MRRRLPVILFGIAVLMLSSVAVSSATSGPGSFSPSPVNFGPVDVGGTDTVTVQVTNNGDTNMTVNDAGSDVVFGGTNPAAFDKTNDHCAGQTLAGNGNPGDSCTLDVKFAPGVVQDYSATLTLVSDSAGPDEVDLKGNGVQPVISVSPSPDTFGNQKVGTTSGAHTYNITNSGDPGSVLDIAQVTMASGSDSAFSIASDNCSGGLAPCTVSVTFSPGTEGDKSAGLSVTSSDQGVAPVVDSLTGTGALPTAAVPNAVAFATPLNVPQVLAVKLTNNGPVAMQVDHATLSGSAEFSNTGTGNCGNATLAANGGSCSAQIKFLPTSGGPAQGSVSFVDDAPDSPQSVPISGTVLVPGIQPNPTSVAFGDLTAGHLSASRQVTITNTGGANLNISSVKIGGTNAGAFKLASQTCTDGPIAPNNSCTANVAFAPSRAGSRVGTVTFVNNAGPDQSVSLTGQGAPPPDATKVTAAAGCSDVKLTWLPPDGAQFFHKVIVVRKSKSYPTGPGDGTIVKHSGPSVIDTAPKQFHTYRYTIFAQFGSYNGERVIYSTGVHAKARTGRICSPRNNGQIRDLTPKVDWTAYTGTRSYAFILQRSGRTIWVRYVKRSEFQIPSSWTYNRQQRSLTRGGSYTLYLYSYTRRHPNGVSIGHTTWLEQ